jgi:hypothetical protein
MQTTWMHRLETLGWLFRRAGPYVALELLLPGGTLFALALFLYQRRGDERVRRPLRALRRWVDGARAFVTPPGHVRASMTTLVRIRATV